MRNNVATKKNLRFEDGFLSFEHMLSLPFIDSYVPHLTNTIQNFKSPLSKTYNVNIQVLTNKTSRGRL